MAFFAGSLVFLAFWVILFIKLKPKHRMNVLLPGIFWGIGGLIEGYYLYALDWVNPPRLFGLSTGIEDFICAFAIAGSVSMLWPKTIKKLEKVERQHFLLRRSTAIILPFLFIVSRFILTYGFAVHSFYSLLIASLFIIIFFCWLIPEMIMDIIKTSILFFFLTLLHIQAFLWVDEKSIENSWLWEEMPFTTTLWELPVMDIIWGVVLAVFIRAVRLAWAVTDAQAHKMLKTKN